MSNHRELVFDVTPCADGGFAAEAQGERISTLAASWDELCDNVREAVATAYGDRPAPQMLRLNVNEPSE